MGHSNTQRRHKSGRVLAALVLTAGLIGAACGGDDAKTGTTDTAGVDTTTGDTAAAATTVPPPTTAAEEVPVPGGSMVFAVEPAPANPWRPSEILCAASCHQVLRNIFDSLTLPNSDGSWSPYLAESVVPNDDFTEWTITAREGVAFHDGTAFDGAAIVDNLERARIGTVTQFPLQPITGVELVDPMTAKVTLNTSWVAFPFILTGQVGYIASPTWLAASDADALLKTLPVGTGPFVSDSYADGESFLMSRNDSYWNDPYPFLDSLEFRFIPDALSRRDALKSGTVDVIHTTNGATISEFRESTDFAMTEVDNQGETAYTLLHVTQEGSPLNDRRIRCALAYARDEQAVLDVISDGVGQIAFGPFSPTQVGYLESTGYPEAQDMAKAQELIADYKAEFPGPLSLALAATTDETNLTIAQFQQEWFLEAGIDEVTIDQLDQGIYVVTAALGNFQVFQFRNHGGFDLDMQYHFWHSSAAEIINPALPIALNFGRIKDATLDALLDENRASNDPVRKKAIAEEVNRLFGTECYNMWESYTIWGIAHKLAVHGPTGFELPDGTTAVFGAGISGVVYPMTFWVEQ